MRKATNADAELRLYEIRREPELRRARQWFLTGFKPANWAEIKSRYLSHSDEDRWFRMTTSYWEMVGTMLSHDAVHAEMLFDHTGEDIVTWERCKSWIADARADIRATYLWRFEQMVIAHLAYRASTIAAFTRRPKAAGAPRAKASARRRRR